MAGVGISTAGHCCACSGVCHHIGPAQYCPQHLTPRPPTTWPLPVPPGGGYGSGTLIDTMEHQALRYAATATDRELHRLLTDLDLQARLGAALTERVRVLTAGRVRTWTIEAEDGA